MTQPEKKTWVEDVEVAGRDAVAYVKRLVEQGNVRRVIVRRPDGKKIVEFPVTPGVVVGGAALVFAPLFSALTAAVLFLANVRLEIVREDALPDASLPDDDDEAKPRKTRIDIE